MSECVCLRAKKILEKINKRRVIIVFRAEGERLLDEVVRLGCEDEALDSYNGA